MSYVGVLVLVASYILLVYILLEAQTVFVYSFVYIDALC